MGAANPVKIDPEIMHGTPRFAGTRVPVSILFDYLADNRTVEFFLEQYPTVQREQVDALLDQAEELVSRPAESKVA
jgi:uncharacterized protein (DUF433 family)